MHFHVQIIQLYIYCIRHWNWNPFPFLSFPLFLSSLYTHVYVYICFLVHYIYLLRVYFTNFGYFTNFEFKCYIYPKIWFKKGQNVVQDVNEHYICKIELINITLYPYLCNIIITLCINIVYVLNHINFLRCFMHETDLNY